VWECGRESTAAETPNVELPTWNLKLETWNPDALPLRNTHYAIRITSHEYEYEYE